MCKNMIIGGIKPHVAKNNLQDFLIAATPFMAAGDRDGLGYVALGKKGLWGERWLRPEDYWNYRKEWSGEDQAVVDSLKGTVSPLHGGARYAKFGELTHENSDSTTAVLYHARMATCEKSLENVHPFIDGTTALIHNGVIRNHEKLTKKTSTNDSETILHEYIKENVTLDPANIQKVINTLEGYYCCGVLSQQEVDGKTRHFLDIWRSNGAQLYAYWVDELETIVFCTSDSIIRETCKKLNWKYGSTLKFQDDLLLRMDAVTGEYIQEVKYKLPTYSQGQWNSNYSTGGYRRNGGYGCSSIGGSSNLDEKKSPALTPMKTTNDSGSNTTETVASVLDGVARFGKDSSHHNITEIVDDVMEKLKDPHYVEAEGFRGGLKH